MVVMLLYTDEMPFPLKVEKPRKGGDGMELGSQRTFKGYGIWCGTEVATTYQSHLGSVNVYCFPLTVENSYASSSNAVF
jgi:hypothetical protein